MASPNHDPDVDRKSVDSGHYPDAGDLTLTGTEAPTHAAIAAKAYELWIAQGCPPDSAMRNWLEAEQELSAATSTHGERAKAQGGISSR